MICSPFPTLPAGSSPTVTARQCSSTGPRTRVRSSMPCWQPCLRACAWHSRSRQTPCPACCGLLPREAPALTAPLWASSTAWQRPGSTRRGSSLPVRASAITRSKPRWPGGFGSRPKGSKTCGGSMLWRPPAGRGRSRSICGSSRWESRKRRLARMVAPSSVVAAPRPSVSTRKICRPCWPRPRVYAMCAFEAFTDSLPVTSAMPRACWPTTGACCRSPAGSRSKG